MLTQTHASANLRALQGNFTFQAQTGAPVFWKSFDLAVITYVGTGGFADELNMVLSLFYTVNSQIARLFRKRFARRRRFLGACGAVFRGPFFFEGVRTDQIRRLYAVLTVPISNPLWSKGRRKPSCRSSICLIRAKKCSGK